MNIEIKRKKSNKKQYIKFRTLLIISTIVLALLFQTVYVVSNIQTFKKNVRDNEMQVLSAYHNSLCDDFRGCMSESNRLQSFIQRNALPFFVQSNLNLLEEDLALEKKREMSDTIKHLSVSGNIIRDFVLFGNNFNQQNLSCNVTKRTMEDVQFPTVDVLEKTGLSAILHTNLGYMVEGSDEIFSTISTKRVSEQEAKTVENVIAYLRNEYFVCVYVDRTLCVIRFNKEYIQDRFQDIGNSKMIVYHSAKRPLLCFNTEVFDANGLADQIDFDSSYYESDQHIYLISHNLYGNLSVVTEYERNEDSYYLIKIRYLCVALACAGILLSLLFVFLFSNRIFNKLNILHSALLKQAKLRDFSLINFDKNNSHLEKMTFSRRILLTLICSSLTSLLIVTGAFYQLTQYATEVYVEKLAEYSSKTYVKQFEMYYERYQSLSMEKTEQFLKEFHINDSVANLELMQRFETSFYYETTFLPGYSYAFIVDRNDNVLYQTAFFSQTQMSNEFIRQALTKAEKLNTTGCFVPVHDLLTEKEMLAYVEEIDSDGVKIGTMVIVAELPNPSFPDENNRVLWETSVLDEQQQVIAGNLSKTHRELIYEKNMSDAENNCACVTDDKLVQWLGRSVVVADYSLYEKQLQQAQYMNLFWVLIVSIICIVVAIILKRFLIKPFNQLMKSMDATTENNYEVLSDDYVTDEVNAIAKAYNQMILRLEEMVKERIQQEHERKELELLQAHTELKMLEQQINPHFLFNTLEMINLTALKNEDEEMYGIVQSLSSILRYAVNKATMVRVRQEIEVLKSYISIQELRFGDKLSFALQLDETLFDLNMIKFVLQPIVENAISHGIMEKACGGTIRIELSCYDMGIQFCISDDGAGMSEQTLLELRRTIYGESEETTEKLIGGIGLKNVYRRIALFYNGKGDLLIQSVEGEGTEVIIRIPFER